MTPLNALKMMFSDHAGWEDLIRVHPSVLSMFARVVAPMSLLPPIMLWYAANYHGDEFLVGFAGKPWGLIAGTFFVAELVSVAAMGWVIRAVADNHGVPCDYHDAYVLAGMTPLPMWLSSLALAVPSIGFVAAVAVVGLGLSILMTYHGVRALFHAEEQIVAASITYSVMGAGILVWALLLTLVLTA